MLLYLKTHGRKLLTASIAAIALGSAPLALSHLVKEEPMQSYRQSYFTLVAMNFGPIASMVKGEMPWDDARMLTAARNFSSITSINVIQAFPPGSDKGTTRAKPEIWENTDDVIEKFEALQASAVTLLAAVESGDKKAIGGAVKETGGACKACHDEYKAKDYLY